MNYKYEIDTMCSCGIDKSSRLRTDKLLTVEELAAEIIKDLESKFMISIYCEDETGREYEIKGLNFAPIDYDKLDGHDKILDVSKEDEDTPSIHSAKNAGRDLSSEAVTESHTLSGKESVTECHDLKGD